MPTDICERLRHADVHSQQRVLGSRIFGETADTIEALRVEVSRLSVELEGARKATIEEMALVADQYMPQTFDSLAIAAAIRQKGETQ